MSLEDGESSLGKYIEEKRLSGAEIFKGMPKKETVLDYWRWAFSNLLGNTERGTLAEFIVASALGIEKDEHFDWNMYDLKYHYQAADGKIIDVPIEVKCSGYLQQWKQKTYSKIIWDIAKKKGWNPLTNEYAELGRHSKIYCFCLLAETDKSKVDVLDMEQWRFYIAKTSEIDLLFGDRKTISLHQVENKLGLKPVTYGEIKNAVDRACG